MRGSTLRIAAGFATLAALIVVVVAVLVARLPADRSASWLAPRVALAAVVAGGAAASLGVLLARPLVASLGRTERALLALARGELGQRLPVTGPPESAELAAVFNRTAGVVQLRLADLAAERQRLTASLAATANAVFAIDEQTVVRYANPAAEAATGPATGRPFAEVARNHELSGLVRTALAGGGRMTASLALQSREPASAPHAAPITGGGTPHRARIVPGSADAVTGGAVRWYQATASPIVDGGEWALLLVLQEITEVRRAEATRRDFIANVSHELRTPLAGIKAVVETLRDGALDDPATAGEFLGRVDSEVDRLIHLVEELLQLARIESGAAPMVMREVRPEQILAATVERFRHTAERAGVELALDLPADLPAIRADPGRLEQAVGNLVHNAIKFTPAGGRVTVAAEIAAGGVQIMVRDTGQGIDGADLPRIFERFYVADRARSGSGRGTGLGLAIVKHVVLAHGGTVEVASTPGRGSTFTIELPLSGDGM